MNVDRPNGSGGTYKAGVEYDLPDDLAALWRGQGVCRLTSVRSEQTGAVISATGGNFPDAPVQNKRIPLEVVTSGDEGIGNYPTAGTKVTRGPSPLRPVHYSCFASSLSNVDNSGSLANYLQAIMLPVKFQAIRIGYPHMGGNGALSGLKMLLAATDDIGDLSYTNTVNCKKFITPMRSGVENNAVQADGWQAVTWSGASAATAQDLGTDMMDVAWTDIIPVSALPLASDPTGRFAGYYPLLARVYPGAGYFTRSSYIGFSDPTKFLAECGPQVVLGASKGGGDFVTTPASWNQAGTPAFSDSAVLPMIVEAYCEGRAPSVMIVGDSRFASASPTESGTNAYRTLSTKVEQVAVADGVPLKLMRCCQGQKSSSIYFQRASKILAGAVQPNVSIYLGYSINEGSPTAATLSAAKARVLQHVDQCVKQGIIPLIVSIFPAGTGITNLSGAVAFDAFCAGLGFPCVSPLKIYGDVNGGWANAADHSDSDHMSPAGYSDLAARIYALLKSYF